jgi:hypothetical protein
VKAVAGPLRHGNRNHHDKSRSNRYYIQPPQGKEHGLLKDPLETINKDASQLKDPAERIMPTLVLRCSKATVTIKERRYPAWTNCTPLLIPPKQIMTHSTESNEFTPSDHRSPSLPPFTAIRKLHSSFDGIDDYKIGNNKVADANNRSNMQLMSEACSLLNCVFGSSDDDDEDYLMDKNNDINEEETRIEYVDMMKKAKVGCFCMNCIKGRPPRA